MSTPANDVKILVKNVYAPVETQQFVVVDSLLVRALKEMIAAALPGNPLPKHQKLIFGGKICDDDHTLAKVLASQNKDAAAGDNASSESAAPFVFHLMVSSGVPRSRPTTPVARPEPAAEQQQPAAVPAPTPAPAAATAPPQGASATVGAAPAQPYAPTAGFPFMGFFGAAPATAAALPAAAAHHGSHHQLYTQAILMQQQAMILSQIQYLQQLQAHQASAAQSSASPHAAPAAGPHQAHGMFPAYGHFGHPFAHHGYGMPHHPPAYGHGAHNAHAAAHAPGFAAPFPPGVQYPGAAVPPAAVAEPRERGPIAQAFREILPLFDIRLAMKMTFMLFIIGQDTPTDRLIVLALMSFGAYLHITGILGKVFELLKRSRGVHEGNENANGEPDANNANPNGAVNAQARLSAVARYLRISADRGFIHDVRYFFTGLLLSLVPAWHPQPLNADPNAPQRQEPGIAEAAQELPLQGI